MEAETKIENTNLKPRTSNQKHINRLKIAGIFLTLAGLGLFSYFIYSIGVDEILSGIGNIGFAGFGLILMIYFLRICARAMAWKLSVYEPYKLELRDTIPAVIIGEALSAMIPLGILISGTAKAVAVRHRLPLVVGLSSVATENLFYSIVTGLFIVLGAFNFLRNFDLAEGWVWSIDVLIVCVFALILFIISMIVRQWHFASEICEKLYEKGIGRHILEKGRMQVRLFENLIYGFYRRYPKRFLPIFLLQIAFHTLGIIEVWFILSRLSEKLIPFYTAFLLESVSRVILTLFKLIPFLVGVDEAGAQFVTETLALGAGVGVTLAIIRKGRVLFWALMGLLLIVKRGLSLREIRKISSQHEFAAKD